MGDICRKLYEGAWESGESRKRFVSTWLVISVLNSVTLGVVVGTAMAFFNVLLLAAFGEM